MAHSIVMKVTPSVEDINQLEKSRGKANVSPRNPNSTFSFVSPKKANNILEVNQEEWKLI
jgi:hypothetical protein